MNFVNFNVIEINRSMRVPILALCTLLGSVLSTVKVYSPNYLAAKYSDITFDYRISSFGKVPYGHTIVGNLRIAVPENGCGKNVKVDYDPKQRDPLILLVMRGGCPFLEKVQNGQALKAAMVIIIDDHDEEMRYVVPWAENAPSLNVRIPSIVIDYKSGKQLFDDVRKQAAERSLNVVASVSFMITQSATPMIFYKFDLNDRELFETFFALLNFYSGLKKHIILVPGYNIVNGLTENLPSNKFCLNGTTFCEARADNAKVSREDQPLFESIRQICLSRADSDAWWAYVSEFYKQCFVQNGGKYDITKELDSCSRDIVKKLGSTYESAITKMKACANGIRGDDIVPNSQLSKELDNNFNLRSMVDTPVKPSIMINGQVIYGRMTSVDVLKEICAAILIKPQECHEIEKLTAQLKFVEVQSFSFWTALWYLVKLLLVGAVMTVAFYMIYKIKLKKEMEKKLTTEVDSALANYYMQNKATKYEGVKVDDSNASIDNSRDMTINNSEEGDN